MKITFLLDNPKSWFYLFAEELVKDFEEKHEVRLVHSTEDVTEGDLAFFLSCENIIKEDVRSRNKLSLVVHSSSLPQGKGWSPLTWQILEGKNSITNTLFEAVDQVDAGKIFLQNTIEFYGHELLPELHNKQGEAICSLIKEFIEKCPEVEGVEQSGEESFYDRRGPDDSEINPDKSISEQFNILRVVDNEKYPAFFKYKGKKYILKIYKDKDYE